MSTPILWTNQLFYLPRPSRLYHQVRSRQHRSITDSDLVEAIQVGYGLQVQGETEVPTGRSRSVLLTTSAGNKLLKRYQATLAPDVLLHEHSILKYLAQIDFPAPRLTPALNGQTLIQSAGRYYALFDFLEGYFQYHHYFLLPSQAQHFISASGKALGALHTALREFIPTGSHPNGLKSKAGERWRELDWFIDKLDWCRPLVADLQGDGADLLRRSFAAHANWIEETLYILDQRIKAARLPSLIIHGDYGPYNLFFKQGASTIILDFELARLDWRLADLAMALPFFATDLLGFSYSRMIAFLSAYRRGCAIDAAELGLLPTVWQFLMLRQVLFFWYRFCNTPSKHWITEAQRKLKIGLWLKENQTTLSGWLTRV